MMGLTCALALVFPLLRFIVLQRIARAVRQILHLYIKRWASDEAITHVKTREWQTIARRAGGRTFRGSARPPGLWVRGPGEVCVAAPGWHEARNANGFRSFKAARKDGNWRRMPIRFDHVIWRTRIATLNRQRQRPPEGGADVSKPRRTRGATRSSSLTPKSPAGARQKVQNCVVEALQRAHDRVRRVPGIRLAIKPRASRVRNSGQKLRKREPSCV